MTLSAYTGLDNQKWQFNYMDNGEFRLISMEDNVPTSGQYVYALNASSSTYVNAQPGDAALLSQRWVLNGKMDNIRIISKVYGTALNAAGPLIVTLSNQNTINERWELIEASNPYMLPYIEGELSVNKINNTTLRSNMNCYSYALGYYTYERDYLQPGKLSGAAFSFYDFQSYFDYYYDRVVISEEGIEAIIEAIINKVNNDLNVLCGDSTSVQRIYPSSLNERIVGPWKKVALVIDPVSFTFSSMFHDFDYHWYIQHEDGKWSHKRGTTNAYVTDNSAAIITNPETCNRDYGIYNYSIFAGYYKIRIDAVIHDGKRSSNDMYKWDNAGDIASMSNSLSLISSSSPAIVSGSIEYWNIVLPNTGASEPDSDRYCWQGDIDWYEFMVNEAGVYVIRTYGNNGLYGVLYEGKTFMQSSSGVYMQVALSPGKLYKLKILGVSSGNNGDYTLSIVKS